MSLPNLALPEFLGILQAWAIRSFIFLGFLTMLPAILVLLYDATLYIWRYLLLTGTPLPEQLVEAPAREELDEEDMSGNSSSIKTRSALTTVTGRRRRALSGGAEPPTAIYTVERFVEPVVGG